MENGELKWRLKTGRIHSPFPIVNDQFIIPCLLLYGLLAAWLLLSAIKPKTPRARRLTILGAVAVAAAVVAVLLLVP